jgi:hypothetical protein
VPASLSGRAARASACSRSACAASEAQAALTRNFRPEGSWASDGAAGNERAAGCARRPHFWASKTFSIVVAFVVMFWLSRHFAFKEIVI